jgi:hypothetical protein
VNFAARANLTAVNSFRIWLLLLLAVLLPIRGALAAGMLCPVGEFGVQAEAQLVKHTHAHEEAASGHEHQGADGSAHDHAAAHGHSDGAAHDHGSAADKCNLCSAFCSVTGLVSTNVTVAVSKPGSAVFSHLYVPPMSFVSDGQERPPRTI